MSRILGRAINPLVALAAESYAHNKEKKARGDAPTASHQPSSSSAPPSGPSEFEDLPPDYRDIADEPKKGSRSPSLSEDDDSEGDETDNDEDDWVRDATQQELEGASPAKEGADPNKLLKQFFERHPNHLRGAPFRSIPCPVIIPQRRPNQKSRGFVLAYAPVLQDAGIDQAMFLDFITGFEQAIKGQGYFSAFNIAVAISALASTAAAVPEVAVHLAALAVHLSVEAGRRVYENYKYNGYLDLMNEHLFKPHGLYAMIMNYKPGVTNVSQLVDMNTNTTSAVAAHEGGRSKIHEAAGKARSEDQIPQCAELVFPKLEAATDEQKQNAFKRSMAFLGEFQDKRAQATFQQKNPESKLNIPGAQPQFASSLGDPRNPAYSGGIINLLSGGRSGGRKRERHAYKDQRRVERKQLRAYRRGYEYVPSRREERRMEMGSVPGDGRSMREIRKETRQKRKDQGLTPVSFVKRQLNEGMLYLMVVNMPSEQEMAEAAALTKKTGIFSLS